MRYSLPCGPGALAVITTAAAPGPFEHCGAVELTRAAQIHSDIVLESAAPGIIGEGDAVITREAALAPAVLTADCVPVLIASESGTVRAATHAGRKGLQSRIITKTIERLRELTGEPLWALIGPHICARCYEVPAELQEEVARERDEARATTSWGTPGLNLTAMARRELADGGVHVVEVDVPTEQWCTLENEAWWSYRRDGTSRRITSALLIDDTPSPLPPGAQNHP
ncbi:polyphenol oxidase family protein [Bowdeniella massiliensis]|uniref:polyphenol oxidase family protein n=1 Tax=Bowdeniella massiliensis TaxID=2932264 RepID=UPI00202854DD